MNLEISIAYAYFRIYISKNTTFHTTKYDQLGTKWVKI